MSADDPTSVATQVFPPPWLVLVGASGGEGLRQMIDLVEHLPPSLPAAVLFVLHRPEDRPSHLPDILRRASRLPVRLPAVGEPLQSGVCYLGPPDRHLRVALGPRADFAADHVYRGTNIDLLFESAARLARPKLIGVVLAGALRDGSQGLAAIKKAGGCAMIIDEAWSECESMPRAATLAVPDADVVADVREIAEAIVRTAASVPA